MAARRFRVLGMSRQREANCQGIWSPRARWNATSPGLRTLADSDAEDNMKRSPLPVTLGGVMGAACGAMLAGPWGGVCRRVT